MLAWRESFVSLPPREILRHRPWSARSLRPAIVSVRSVATTYQSGLPIGLAARLASLSYDTSNGRQSSANDLILRPILGSVSSGFCIVSALLELPACPLEVVDCFRERPTQSLELSHLSKLPSSHFLLEVIQRERCRIETDGCADSQGVMLAIPASWVEFGVKITEKHHLTAVPPCAEVVVQRNLLRQSAFLAVRKRRHVIDVDQRAGLQDLEEFFEVLYRPPNDYLTCVLAVIRIDASAGSHASKAPSICNT